jgi:hypothetical protein
MSIVLLLLGIVVTAAGGAMLAYGIPNNGFEVGNALIVAGTAAVTGGIVIIGVSSAIRELARMNRMLDTRLPAGAAAAAQPAERGREKPGAASEQKPAAEKAPSAPDLAAAPAEPRLDFAAEPAPSATDPFAPPSRGEARGRDGTRERGFDTVWAPPTAPKAEPAAAKPPASDQPKAPEIRPPEVRAPEVRAAGEPLSIRPSREPQAVTILKSGVIEGMAYTLYSDGSIEADLPQGMARFSSIDALRRHLGEQS